VPVCVLPQHSQGVPTVASSETVHRQSYLKVQFCSFGVGTPSSSVVPRTGYISDSPVSGVNFLASVWGVLFVSRANHLPPAERVV
jgi:hypothetical protein